MQMEISFLGGVKVAAAFRDLTVVTDQSPAEGGDNTALSPFELFLASLGTCAGYYVLKFCQQRNIPTAGLRLVEHFDWDSATHMVRKIELELQLPPDFPEQYKSAVVRAADLCTVRKHLLNPPEVLVTTTTAT